MEMPVTSGGGDTDPRLVLVEFPARRRGTGAAIAGVAGAASPGAASAGTASSGDPGDPIPGVALLTLNRRRALNALSFAVLTELADAAEALDANPDVRAVVITGTGSRAFAAGADVAELSEQTPASLLESRGFRGWDRVAAVGVPTIAAVRGFALGGGAELAMACDMIIAGSDAVFGQPEVKLGVIPGAGGTQRLTRAIGQARAMELILTGRQVAADEAERLGLVTRVVPAEETLATALDLASAIAVLPASAVRAAKAAVRAAAETPLAAGIDRERGLFSGLFGTPDQVEGMAAFLGKRQPRWSHDR
jgi:enoyl-CoA hydratase